MSVDEESLRAELDRLVHPVDDVDGLVGQIERRRAQVHRRRTAVRLLAAASVLVLIGVAAVAFATRGDDSEVVTAGPPTSDPSVTPMASSGPSVTVTTTDLEPLEVTTTAVARSEDAWLEHALTLRNPGDGPVLVIVHPAEGTVDDPRLTVSFGSGATPVGGPSGDGTGPGDQVRVLVTGGHTATIRVLLDRAGPLSGDPVDVRQPVAVWSALAAEPLDDPDASAIGAEAPGPSSPAEGSGTIALTYRNLADAGSSDEATTPTVGSTESRPDLPQGAAPGPDDDVPALFFDPPAGFDEHRSSERVGPDGGTILVYSFVLESWVVQGGIGQELNVAVMRVRDDLAEIDDPVAFAEQSMGSERDFVGEEVGGRRVAVARRSAVLSGEDLGLPDRVSDTYSLRIGDAAIQIHTMDVAEPAVVEDLIASIDEAALARALAAG